MTRIIIEADNNKDVTLIKELADRLKIKYEIQNIAEDRKGEDNISVNWQRIKKGVDVSNYGDPSLWQKEVRENRNINFPQ